MKVNDKTILEFLNKQSAKAKDILKENKLNQTSFYYSVKGLMVEGYVSRKDKDYQITEKGIKRLEVEAM